VSYYDHATMMAHKLGPWADDPGGDGGDIEGQHREPGMQALKRSVGRMLSHIGIRIAAGFARIPPAGPALMVTNPAKPDTARCFANKSALYRCQPRSI